MNIKGDAFVEIILIVLRCKNTAKTQSKHPHFENLSVSVWTGPLSDLNLQPVFWHAYNTCSYASLRHIRLWNSTSSAGPLTICHFLKYFPSRLFFTIQAKYEGEVATHSSFMAPLCHFGRFFLKSFS